MSGLRNVSNVPELVRLKGCIQTQECLAPETTLLTIKPNCLYQEAAEGTCLLRRTFQMIAKFQLCSSDLHVSQESWVGLSLLLRLNVG